MGDRALIICTTNGGDTTPALYLHWGGHKVSELLTEAAPMMRKR